MRLSTTTLCVIVILLAAATGGCHGRRQMKGGKAADVAAHSRAKRTIGDIISWKVNLLQSIFGGVFGGKGGGGGGSSYGPPKNTYGPPKNNKPPRQKILSNSYVFCFIFC